MKFVAILAGLVLFFSGADAALANNRYDVVAVDDVNGDPTFSGQMTTTAPFSLAYDFSVVGYDLRYITKAVTYDASNSSLHIEAQGFLFTANDASSTFELTFYPDGSYYSEYAVSGLDAYDDSGYFAFASTSAVPEPGSVALMLAGLGVVGLRVRRQRLRA